MGVLLLIFVPIGAIKLENLLPVFQTDMKGYMEGSVSSLNAFLGFSIVLFYISLVKKPEKTAKMTVLGITFPIIFYTITFIVCIGVFGFLDLALGLGFWFLFFCGGDPTENRWARGLSGELLS